MKTLLGVIISIICMLPCSSVFGDESTNLPCGITIAFESTNTVPLGSNIVWALTLVNQSATSQTCHVALDGDAVFYNGVFVDDVSQVVWTNILAPGNTNTTTLTLTPNDYTSTSQTTLTYEVTAFVDVLSTNDIWVSEDRALLSTSTNFLSLSPSLEVAVGNCLTAEVSYLHPLAADLFGVEVCLTADEKLSTNGTLVEHSFSLGTITNGQWINVSTNFTAGATGSSTVWATIIASNLVGIGMSKDISVVE